MSCGNAYGENVQFKLIYGIHLKDLTWTTVPELRIYKVWDRPIGPHPIAMFEVNIFTPGIDFLSCFP